MERKQLIQEKIFEEIEKCILNSDFIEAIDLAISGYLIFRNSGDDDKEWALSQLRVAIYGLDETGRDGVSEVCSFCGKSPNEVKLGAGHNAFICNECVETFHEIFVKSL